MGKAKSFKVGMSKPHLLRSKGLSGEISKLRRAVDTALELQEEPELSGYAPVLAQAIGVADKVITSQYGVANDAATDLLLVGSGFNGGEGRDGLLVEDNAGANSGIRFVALKPGDSRFDLAFVEAVAAVSVVYSLSSSGRHQIWIRYNPGVSTPADIRTALGAVATAKDLLAVVGFTGGTGGGAITATNLVTLGSTASATTSTYHPMKSITTTIMPGAKAVTVTAGTVDYVANAHSFRVGPVTSSARLLHVTLAYPISQAAAVIFPSDTCLQVSVAGNHADFTGVLTINKCAIPVVVSCDGVQSNSVYVHFVDAN